MTDIQHYVRFLTQDISKIIMAPNLYFKTENHFVNERI